MKKKWFYIVPLAILAMVLFTFIGGEVVLRLWNWLLPPLFGWRPITFWQEPLHRTGRGSVTLRRGARLYPSVRDWLGPVAFARVIELCLDLGERRQVVGVFLATDLILARRPVEM